MAQHALKKPFASEYFGETIPKIPKLWEFLPKIMAIFPDHYLIFAALSQISWEIAEPPKKSWPYSDGPAHVADGRD